MDDVVPLAVRCIQTSVKVQPMGTGQSPEPALGTPVVNWLQSISSEELAELQKADPVLSILHIWKTSGTLPTKDQVAFESPAVRKFWLCWPQVVLQQGVFYYSWERVGAQHPALLQLVPASIHQEVLQACHDPPHSGHLGEAKTLERLRQSYHWHGMGEDIRLFIKRCQHCNACKAKGQLNGPSCKVIKLERLWTVSTWTSSAPF